MFRYENEQCQYCHETFCEQDDVVVCPECGSPYHRDCYKQSGACVRVDLHESGESYKSKEKEATVQEEIKLEIKCPNCQALNDINKEVCDNCGFILKQPQSFKEVMVFDPYAFDENQELDEGVTAGDVSKYLGQNSGYFISKYNRMKKTRNPISFNFAAFFFNYMYLIYRKGFVLGIILALILGVLNLPTTFVAMSTLTENIQMPQFAFLTSEFVERMTNVSVYTDTLVWLIEISIALFFNWFYMKSVIKKVKSMKKIYGNDYSAVAAKNGGVLGRKIIIILFAIYFGLVFLMQLLMLF